MTDYFEDVGAYLLGALTEPEYAAFARQLEHDDALRAEVEYLRVAADALPASPMQWVPPPHLKARVMATVNAEAALFRAAEERPEPSRSRRRVVAVLRPGWWSLRPGIAVAASVVVLAVGAAIGGLVASGSGPAKDTVVAAVHGHAKLIKRATGHSTLTATGLRSPGPGRVYQVWLQRGSGKPRPTNALFGARKDGTASVDVPGSMKGVDKVLVTNEPDGGSATPTTAPVIEVHPA